MRRDEEGNEVCVGEGGVLSWGQGKWGGRGGEEDSDRRESYREGIFCEKLGKVIGREHWDEERFWKGRHIKELIIQEGFYF